MAANTQMPQLSSTNICTVQAKEAQHTGLGIWKTRLSMEAGSERGRRSVQCISADNCAAGSPKLWCEAPLSDGVCVPQYQAGPQLLDTASCALAAAGLWHMHWHKLLGASLSPPLPCDRSTWSMVWLGQEKLTQWKWPVHPLTAGLIKQFVDSTLDWGKEYFGNNSGKGEGWKWFIKGCFSPD